MTGFPKCWKRLFFSFPFTRSSKNKLRLNVILDPPSVGIKFGSSIKSEEIKEGSDVFIECLIDANPPPYTIKWTHDVSEKKLKIENLFTCLILI